MLSSGVDNIAIGELCVERDLSLFARYKVKACSPSAKSGNIYLGACSEGLWEV
jgi:hypothetical protein